MRRGTTFVAALVAALAAGFGAADDLTHEESLAAALVAPEPVEESSVAAFAAPEAAPTETATDAPETVAAAAPTETATDAPEQVAVEPPATQPVRTAWYDRYAADEGGVMFWILHAAREAAARGEPTDDLEATFERLLGAWLAEEGE